MSVSERRGAVRTGVVWDALRQALETPGAYDGEHARIVDIGGGTGGFAVPLAELGHRVLVVDPSPDALAALDRRAAERHVTDRVTGVQGDLADLRDLVDGADVVLCHGVLEIVDDPAAALATIAGVLRPGGTLSLLVAQRHAAVIARAMAGHFQQARALLAPADPAHPAHRDTGNTRVAAPATGSPMTSSPPWSSPPGWRCPRSTPSGSSPIWCPAPCSTSSPAPPRPWSSWRGPWPSVPSTSPSPPSCTCSRDAEPRGVCPR